MTAIDIPRPPQLAPLGRIVTFYSYKGGTGRSMTLANVGWILAFFGYRVLLIDWDLEAPGLHRYFHPFLRDKHSQSTPGLFDLVESLAARAATSAGTLSNDEVDIFGYLTQLECPRDSWVRLPWGIAKERTRPRVEGALSTHQAPAYVGIDLMPAGRQGPTYAGRLNSFNWISFYERLEGRRLLGLARQQMRETYDYVLIDSRTGVSDTSGICTVEMPDTLVVCFTLNDQSILGASGVVESILTQRAQLKSPADTFGRQVMPFRILPVPTRVEVTSERDKRDAALDLAQRTFAPFLSPRSASEQSKYWGRIQMAYFPYYAFEEIPAVFGDRPDDEHSLTRALLNLTQAITGSDLHQMTRMAIDHDTAERTRREILNWYLRPVAQRDSVTQAQQIFDGFGPVQQETMKQIALRLVSIGGSARAATWDELRGVSESMTRQLIDQRLLIASESEPRTVRFSEPAVGERWNLLREWLDADRPFLTWRTSMGQSMESWRTHLEDSSLLLRGALLGEADKWLPTRADDLTAAEREYVGASLRAQRIELEEERRRNELAEATHARNVELEELLQEVEKRHLVEKHRNQRRSAMKVFSLAVTLSAVAMVGYVGFLRPALQQPPTSESDPWSAVPAELRDAAGDPDTRAFLDFDGDGALENCRIVSGEQSYYLCSSSRNVFYGLIDQAGLEDWPRNWIDWDGDGIVDWCRIVGQDLGDKSLRCNFGDRKTMSESFTSAPFDVGYGLSHPPRKPSFQRIDGVMNYCRSVGGQNSASYPCRPSTKRGLGSDQ